MMNDNDATPLTKPRHWMEVISAMIKPKTKCSRGLDVSPARRQPGLTEIDTSSSRGEDDHTDANGADGVTSSDDDGSHGVKG